MPDFQEYFDQLFAPSSGGPFGGFGLTSPEETIDRLHYEAVQSNSFSQLGLALSTAVANEFASHLPIQTSTGIFEQFLSDLASGSEEYEARSSWEGFILRLRELANDELEAIMSPLAGTLSDNPYSGQLFAAFKNSFETIAASDWGDLNQGLLAAFQNPDSGIFDPQVVDANSLSTKMFSLSFRQFISTLPFASLSSNPSFTISFDRAHALWLGLRVGLEPGLAPPNVQSTAEFGQPDFTSFREIYFSFVRNATEAQYMQRLTDFAVAQIRENGYFIPSHFLGEWFDEVKFDEILADGELASTAGAESFRTQILFDLFALVVEMLDVLQRVSSAQAARLGFYAEMQKAYTNLISQIPIITEARITSSTGIGEGETLTTLLNKITAINQSYTEKLRSFRSVVGDEGKQHQTSVNQSTETVNQQAQLGTSILQQMSTILTTIFK